jgi:hypothetical protein
MLKYRNLCQDNNKKYKYKKDKKVKEKDAKKRKTKLERKAKGKTGEIEGKMFVSSILGANGNQF